ncbi:MAG: type VII secretion-associated serine protease mycosin [Streptosporangiales bacterium]|nr:type VII secretion-associated serine protease mycosin [Streptosporangiales bacterium]
MLCSKRPRTSRARRTPTRPSGAEFLVAKPTQSLVSSGKAGRFVRPALWFLGTAAAVNAAAVFVLPARPAVADNVRASQWHLLSLDVAKTHRVSRGKGVTVAVIDSGVQASHPDLRGSVVRGRDFVGDTDGRVDRNGHGTGVAALIAGHGHGTGDGALGLAPRATILPVRVSNPNGKYTSTAAAQGVRWAVDHGADVINMSGGASADDPALRGAVAYAQARDVVVVASAGNTDQGDRRVLYPAAYPGVVAVSAVDGTDKFSPDSVRGPRVALAAPGVRVVTATTDGGYAIGAGTSDAAALVSGAAALVRAEHPDLDATNVVNRLIRTAEDRGPSGRDPRYGFGTVVPVAALTADVPRVAENPLGTTTVSAPRRHGFRPPGASGTPGGDAEPGVVSGLPARLLPALVGAAAVLLACLSVAVGWMVTARRRSR